MNHPFGIMSWAIGFPEIKTGCVVSITNKTFDFESFYTINYFFRFTHHLFNLRSIHRYTFINQRDFRIDSFLFFILTPPDLKNIDCSSRALLLNRFHILIELLCILTDNIQSVVFSFCTLGNVFYRFSS